MLRFQGVFNRAFVAEFLCPIDKTQFGGLYLRCGFRDFGETRLPVDVPLALLFEQVECLFFGKKCLEFTATIFNFLPLNFQFPLFLFELFALCIQPGEAFL